MSEKANTTQKSVVFGIILKENNYDALQIVGTQNAENHES